METTPNQSPEQSSNQSANGSGPGVYYAPLILGGVSVGLGAVSFVDRVKNGITLDLASQDSVNHFNEYMNLVNFSETFAATAALGTVVAFAISKCTQAVKK